MSAIFGIARFDGRDPDAAEIERMGRTLAHRGPDGRHSQILDGAGLGHCLMRVNREEEFDAQPIVDRGAMLVADVRLDNREDLAAAIGLTTRALAAMSDSALVMAAYRHWGEACVDRLLGDYVFAIWDAKARSLFLARDHMGQRGLFYHAGDGFVAFASEIKALWTITDVPRRIRDGGIGAALLLPLDRERGSTMYEGITVLCGGTTLTWHGPGPPNERRYWTPGPLPEHVGRDADYYLETYRRIVEEAILCRVRRVVRPPALCFSGGFDSGTIAAVAGREMARRGARLIAMSSVAPAGEWRLKTSARHAVEAFRRYPFLDIRFFVREHQNSFTDIERDFDRLDGQLGSRYVRNGLYGMAAQAGARLVIDGHGGDYTVNTLATGELGRILRHGHVRRFAREMRRRVALTGYSVWRLVVHDVLRALMPLALLAWRQRLRRGLRPNWRATAINPHYAKALFSSGKIDPTHLRSTDGAVHARWETRWRDMARRHSSDPPTPALQAAMHGLEFARPFHDKRVVELGLSLPPEVRFRDGRERWLARQTLADILPEQLINRAPGNDAEDPDMYRAESESVDAALADVRQLDEGGRLSRYIDLDRIEALIRGTDERNIRHHRRIARASHALVVARFIAWFDRTNA